MREAVATILMLAALFGYAAWERARWREELKARVTDKLVKILRTSYQPITDLVEELRHFGSRAISGSDAIDAMRYALYADLAVKQPKNIIDMNITA